MGDFRYTITGPDGTEYATIFNAPFMPQVGDTIWAWDHRNDKKEWEGTAKLKVVEIRFGVYREAPGLPNTIWGEVRVEVNDEDN